MIVCDAEISGYCNMIVWMNLARQVYLVDFSVGGVHGHSYVSVSGVVNALGP